MIPKLNDGMPNLNIPALDPFVRDRTAFKFKRPDLFDVAGEVRNLRVIGGSKAVLKSVKWVSTLAVRECQQSIDFDFISPDPTLLAMT